MAEFWESKEFIEVVVQFLEKCSDELGNHGCNDFELPDTQFNRILVARAAWEGGDPNEYKTLEEAIADLHIYDGKILTYDFMVCSKLAEILKVVGSTADKF